MSLDGSACTSTNVQEKEGCILGQIGRALKNAAATTADGPTGDLFAATDMLDASVAPTTPQTWTYSPTTSACTSATTGWLGVQCAQVGGTGPFRVVSVDLQSVGLRNYKPLSGTIPTLFAMLTALTYLNLAYNKLSGTLPTITSSEAFVAPALQNKQILAVPTSLREFNVTGNRLGLGVATPLEAAVITNLVTMRSGATPAYALERVDLSTNCMAGGATQDLSAITAGASGLFRVFNLNGNAGSDGTKPLCGSPPTRQDCDGSFTNKFACQDNYFVDFGGQVSAAGGGGTAGSTKETAAVTFVNAAPLTGGAPITIAGLVFTPGDGGVTKQQLAKVFSNINTQADLAAVLTANCPTTADCGSATNRALGFDTGITKVSELKWTSGAVSASGDSVTFTSKQDGNVADLTAIGTGPTVPLKAVTTDNVVGQDEKGIMTVLKAMAVDETVTWAGTTFKAWAATDIAGVRAAFQNLESGHVPAATSTGYFENALLNFNTDGSVAPKVTPNTMGKNVANLETLITDGSSVIVAASGTDQQDGAPASAKVVEVTFPAITTPAAGDQFTFAGLVVKCAAAGSTTADELAAAFGSLKHGMTASYIKTTKNQGKDATKCSFDSGTLTDWHTGAAAGAVVTFTSAKKSGDDTALTYTKGGSSTAAIPATITTSVKTAAAAAKQEKRKITFQTGLTANQDVTIAGLTYKSKAATTVAQLVAAFQNLKAGAETGAGTATGSYSGKLAGWESGAGIGGTAVEFTATTKVAAITDTDYTDVTGTGGIVSVEKLQDGVVPTTGKVEVQFLNDIVKGQSITIGGRTATATAATVTKAELAEGFGNRAGATTADAQAAKIAWSGTASSDWNSNTGDGTDKTAFLVAGTPGAAPAGGPLSLDFAGFGTLPFTSSSTGNVVGKDETAAIDIAGGLTAGDTVTFAGTKFTAWTATDAPTLRTAFKDMKSGTVPPATITGYFTGSLVGFDTDTSNAPKITASTVGKDVPDLVVGGSGASTAVTAPSGADVTQGKAAVAKTVVVTFPEINTPAADDTFTLAGLKIQCVAAGATTTGAELAAAFANLKNGMTAAYIKGAPLNQGTGANNKCGFDSGTLADWHTGTASGATVTFTSAKKSGDDTALSYTKGGTKTPADLAAITGTGSVAAANAQTEARVVKFSAVGLAPGQTLSIGGLTYTSKDLTSQSELATAFESLKNGAVTGAGTATGSYSGKLVGWASAAKAGNDVTFTATATVTDIPDADWQVTPSSGTPISARSTQQGVAPVTATIGIAFTQSLAKDQTITIGDRKATAKETVTKEELAQAFGNRKGTTAPDTLSAKITWSGTAADGWNSNTGVGNTVTFVQNGATPGTAPTGGNLASNLRVANSLAASAEKIAPVTLSVVDGAAPTAETAVFTFATGKKIAAGDSFSIAGLKITAAADITSAALSTAFASLAADASSGTGVTGWSGSLTGYTSSARTGTDPWVVTFTSRTTGDVPDLLPVGTGANVKTVTGIATDTQGADAVNEKQVVTFAALEKGRSVTVAGLSFTAVAANAAAAEVAGAFASLKDGATSNAAATAKGTVGGTLTGWDTSAVNTDKVTFTAKTFGNKDDLKASGTDLDIITPITYTQGTPGNYPFALECGGKKQYVNYFMYEACILNTIRNSLDAGVGTPAAQNNTALKTWVGDRACPFKNAANWTGVECDTQERVTGINLMGKQITGSLPLDFFFLEKLKSLDLSVNRISGSFPVGTFYKWTSPTAGPTSTPISMIPTALESLDISDNRLSAAIDPVAGVAIAAAIRKKVDLSNNCFRGPLPAALTSNFPANTTLDLNGNRGKTGTAEELLCAASTQASVLAVCNNKYTNELACRDYAGVGECGGQLWDSYQGFEACLLKRIGTALGADLTALRWVGNVACPPAANPWIGITCDSQLTPTPSPIRDRVVGIDLSNRGLTGSLPFDFYYLSQLQTLNLADNRIKGTLQAQQVTINGTNYTAAPFPPTIRQVFLQGNAISGSLNASIPAFFQLGAQANGSLTLTDFNLTNNCFVGPLSSNFDAFIPRVSRIFLNGNLGLCTGTTTATTLAVCDSSNANAFACAGYPSPAATAPIPNFSTQFQALFRFNPEALKAPGIQKQVIAEIAALMGISPDNLRIEAGYIYDSVTGQVIARFLSKKIATQETQSLLVFRIFADNAAAAQAAINNLRTNAGGSTFGLIGTSIDTNVIATPVTPTAPRAPTGVPPATGPIAPLAPLAPAKSEDDDGWKIGVGVGVGVGGFLLLVIIICIVVFCLKKKAAPLPQEIDYNKVAVVQQGVPGAYPVGAYPVGGYPVYPQAGYAVSAPPPTPAYTYAVAA